MSIIPKQPNNFPIPSFDDITMLIFGAPGTGKTTFCSSGPNSLIFATEPGADFLNAAVVPTYNWETFKSAVAELEQTYLAVKSKAMPKEAWQYDAFVIDIIDNLQASCRDYVCQKRGLQYPPTNDFGKTWSQITAEFKSELRKLMCMGGLRFISHATTQQIEVDSDDGLKVEIDRHIPTFSGSKAAQFLDGIVHCQGYCGVSKKGEHLITFRAGASHGAKDRTGLLAYYGVLPLKWAAVSEAYSNRAHELGRNIISKRERF